MISFLSSPVPPPPPPPPPSSPSISTHMARLTQKAVIHAPITVWGFKNKSCHAGGCVPLSRQDNKEANKRPTVILTRTTGDPEDGGCVFSSRLIAAQGNCFSYKQGKKKHDPLNFFFFTLIVFQHSRSNLIKPRPRVVFSIRSIHTYSPSIRHNFLRRLLVTVSPPRRLFLIVNGFLPLF